MSTSSIMVGYVPDELKNAYQMIAPELQKVSELLLEQIRHPIPYIDGIMQYSFKLGGKRLRPVLVLLCGLACGKVEREHIMAAATLEMIHTGSLIHDDILDGASFRRHLETIHVVWDPKAAVLAGDLLLTLAMQIITRCNDIEVYRLISHACQLTCEGELMQNNSKRYFDMTRQEYFEIIQGKTAALLECCCQLGARFAGADDAGQEAFRRFGHSLGIAFQVVDDILDLTGNEDNVGKTLGTDLLNGKPTLPLILWFENASNAEKEKMLQLLSGSKSDQEKLATIRTILIDSQMVQVAHEMAANQISDALAGLNLGQNITSAQLDARKALADVAQFVISRNR